MIVFLFYFFLLPLCFTALLFFRLHVGEHNRVRPSGRKGFEGESGRKKREAALGQRQIVKGDKGE